MKTPSSFFKKSIVSSRIWGLGLLLAVVLGGGFLVEHRQSSPIQFDLKTTSFTSDGHPTFAIKSPVSLQGAETVKAAGALTLKNGKVTAQVIRQGEIVSVSPEMSISSNPSEVLVEVPPIRDFKPGKYELELTFDQSQKREVVKQDFTWGVLAINTPKSTYSTREKVDIGMAVLDDNGKTLCDSRLTLIIVSPNRKQTVLTSADKDIATSATCIDKSVTDSPDYLTHFTPDQEGVYQLHLSAETKNGTRSISSNLEIRNQPDFLITRSTTMRIYPAATYKVRLGITASRDVQSYITENVPERFEISELPFGATIKEEGDLKLISWPVNLKKGQTKEVSYVYKAPLISPEFYQLGPLEVQSQSGQLLYQEPRSWQIASDAACNATTTGNWSTGGTWTGCTGAGGKPATTDTITINNGVVVTVDGAASPTVAGITIANGGTLIASASVTLVDSGSWANSGTFTHSSGTVQFTSTTTGNTIAGTMTGSHAFYKIAFDGVGGGWTTTGAVAVTAANATDTFVIGNGTVTIGDSDADNLDVRGKMTIANTAGQTGTLQTAALAQGSNITVDINANSSTPSCANCIITVGATSGTGQGNLKIAKNTIVRLNPRSSATASDTGIEVESTGYLEVLGSQDATGTDSDTDASPVDKRETKVCANQVFTTGVHNGKNLRMTSGLANGKIYSISATTVDDTDCATNTHDSITINDTSIPAGTSTSTMTISGSGNTRKICSNSTTLITANNGEVGRYAHDLTGTTGYYKIVTSTNADGACGSSFDSFTIIAEPAADFTSLVNSDTFKIVDGIRSGDSFEVLDYASVTAENGESCNATIDQAGEAYIYAKAGSESLIRYANICNMGRAQVNYWGLQFSGVNGNNSNEGVTIDKSRIYNSDTGITYVGSSNNTGNKGITNSAVYSPSGNGIDIYLASSNNKIDSNSAYSVPGYAISGDTSSNANVFSSNIAYGSGAGLALWNNNNSNLITGNTSYRNTNGIVVTVSTDSNNTIALNTVFGNTTSGIYLDSGTTNTTLQSNSVYANPTGLILNGASAVTGNVGINENYGGVAPNTTADITYSGAGAHNLRMYNSTLASTTEATGVTTTNAYLISRKHDTTSGLTRVWNDYAYPTDSTESPQDETTDSYNYANNLWADSITPHIFTTTGSSTEDTDLSYSFNGSMGGTGGVYTYRVMCNDALYGTSCATSAGSWDVYRNGTLLTTKATTGWQYTDSQVDGGTAPNVRFTIHDVTGHYAQGDSYTFTAYKASGDTLTQKTLTMMQDADTYIVASGKTLQLKGQTASTNPTLITRGATGGYQFTVNGTLDAKGYSFNYLGGAAQASGLVLSAGATITSLDGGSFDNYGTNVGAADSFMNVDSGLITGARTFNGMSFVNTGGNANCNVNATGTDSGSTWTFSATGAFAGESNDCNDGASDPTPGQIAWVTPVTISGTVYMANESTAATTGNGGPCDSATAVVSVRVNGGTAATGSCDVSTGAYSISIPTPTTGDTVTVYLTSTMKANTVTLSSGAAISGLDLYQNTVIARHENAGPIAITDMLKYDTTANATDMLFDGVSGSPNTLTINDGVELHVWTGKTLTPGGTITTSPASDSTSKDGDLHIGSTATLSMGTNALSVGGDYNNGGTFSKSAGQTTTMTATGTGMVITPGTGNFDSLTFNGSGGGWSNNAAMSVDVALTMTAGTLSGTNNVTVIGDVAGTAGVINLTGGTFEQRMAASKNFGATSGSTAWTFNNLTFSSSSGATTSTTQTGGTGAITVTGILAIGKAGDTNSTTLSAGNRTWTLSGTSTPLAILASPLGVLTPSTSTFSFTGNGVSPIPATTYYNLELKPSSSTAQVLGTGTFTISNNLTIGDGTNAGATASANNPIIAVTGSITIAAGATFVAPGSASFTVGTNWTNNGTFTHNSGTVTFNTASTSLISGTTTFNNFTVATAGKTLQFQAGTLNAPVFTFAGTMTVTGGVGNQINIHSATAGTRWLAYFNSTQSSITYAHILDSGCRTGTANASLTGTSTNAGNNGDCWFPVGAADSVRVNGGGVRLNGGTLRVK